MNTRELQDEIIRLKKEKGVCLLAHAYQSQDILEVADYTGDSYGLSLKAKESDAQTIIMCGVRFMAETVKVLSPEKTVYIANSEALCPMAHPSLAVTTNPIYLIYHGLMAVFLLNNLSSVRRFHVA